MRHGTSPSEVSFRQVGTHLHYKRVFGVATGIHTNTNVLINRYQEKYVKRSIVTSTIH